VRGVGRWARRRGQGRGKVAGCAGSRYAVTPLLAGRPEGDMTEKPPPGG
jgi:hypothetical protein